MNKAQRDTTSWLSFFGPKRGRESASLFSFISVYSLSRVTVAENSNNRFFSDDRPRSSALFRDREILWTGWTRDRFLVCDTFAVGSINWILSPKRNYIRDLSEKKEHVLARDRLIGFRLEFRIFDLFVLIRLIDDRVFACTICPISRN